MTVKEFTEAAIAVYLEKGGVVTPDITLNLMQFIEHDEALLADYMTLSEENDYVNHVIGRTVKQHFDLENDKVINVEGQCSLLKNYTRFLPIGNGVSINENKNTMQSEYRMPDPIVKTAKKLLDNAGQIILQGAPGCGKTYVTTELAVYLCDGQVPASRAALKARYKELEAEGRIGFTTFHQSLDYEEFVEGMKPDTENADPSTSSGQASEMRFVVKPGIFKRMCERASNDGGSHVLIIDEINRANISKVLGELITLIEKTKRIGAEDEFCVTLPYSGERFGVPQNLYIIGTMNTADRSLGYIDYAIRRRFAFLPLKSEWAVVREFYGDRGELMNRQHELYTRIRNLVKDHLNEDFLLDDVMIGHSYFLAATEDDYKLNLDYKIRPLLEEYLRDGILVEDGTVKDTIKNLR